MVLVSVYPPLPMAYSSGKGVLCYDISEGEGVIFAYFSSERVAFIFFKVGGRVRNFCLERGPHSDFVYFSILTPPPPPTLAGLVTEHFPR